MYELGIELSIKDVQLLYKIKSILGVGTIFFRKRERIEKSLSNRDDTVIYRIRNKSHLLRIIIPIFEKYPMFTSKQFDFIRFRTYLLLNVIYSKDLLPYNRPKIYFNSIDTIINSYYFPF